MVVGISDNGNADEVFVWDELNGMRSLKQVLIDGGADLNGWTRLAEVSDLSADGTTILGQGYNAQGDYG